MVVWLLAIYAIAHMGDVLADVAKGARLTAQDVRCVARRIRRRHPGEQGADRPAIV